MITGNPQDDRPIPVPPIPPSDGGLAPAASRPDRITQSANPAATIPTGGLGPAAAQSAPAAPDDGSRNKVGMALLAAGLGMMGSKSHTALGAIGEGGLAGVQNLQAQREMDLRQLTLQNQAAYQNAMVGLRGAGVDVQRQRATTAAGLGARHADATDQRVAQQGDHYQRMDDNSADRNANTARYQDGRLDQGDDRLDQNDERNNISRDKLDLQRQTINNTQAWRSFQQQSKATDQEINSARSIMFNATSLGKPMTMDNALSQVRNARSSAGPAPIVGAPVAGTPAAAGRQATADELSGARAAIARGVPRAAVMARFQQSGVVAAGL